MTPRTRAKRVIGIRILAERRVGEEEVCDPEKETLLDMKLESVEEVIWGFVLFLIFGCEVVDFIVQPRRMKKE